MTQRAGPDRADAMARRLARTAARLGVAPEGGKLLLRAFETAMELRRVRIADDHHPDYLHTARTVLILMDDAGVLDPTVLAAAALTETRDPGLAVSEAAVAAVGAEVAEHVAGVPVPGREGDRLLEALLVLPPAITALAVAERLDHARHLHLRERSEWIDYHRVTSESYAPMAHRAQPALAARLDAWCATFGRRFLGD